MRLQLAVPENTFLTPVTFNRMLSLYGATAIFFFASRRARLLLLRGAAADRRPRNGAARLGQIGAWLFIAGATVLYSGFLFTPSEAGVNPLPRSPSSPSCPTTASMPGPRRPAWRRWASS